MFWILHCVYLISLVCFVSSQTITTPPQNETVVENTDAIFVCVANQNGTPVPAIWSIGRITLLSNSSLAGTAGAFLGENGSPLILKSVSRSVDGTQIICDVRTNPIVAGTLSAPVYLTVHYPPVYSFGLIQNTTVEVVEEDIFFYNFTLDANPVIGSDFEWTRDGQMVSGEGRISTTASSITIRNVSRSDSGLYQIVGRNTAGAGMANFTLNVLYPPELNVVDTSQSLTVNDTFTLNCSPVVSNPPANAANFSFNSSSVNQNDPLVSIDTFVLSISTIQRRHRGTYTCEVSNGVRDPTSASVFVNVFGPPTIPQELVIADPSPFSATVRWSAPEDDGGAGPTQYMWTVFNGTVMLFNTTGVTMVTLINLQHSTTYTVTVVARNVHGSSPQLVTMFRTNDSAPIVDKVIPTALSLTNITVNVSLLTSGGQDVTSFKISVNGVTRMTNASPSTSMISIFVGSLNLTKGTDYSVSVTATNSIGESEPVTGRLSVPNPPIPTAPPTVLPPNSTFPCCSGVKLNLARPQDVSDVRVSFSVNGRPYEMVRSGNLTLSGDILYISGLQAGTVYTANITISNIFGSTEQQTILKPILGRPSNPARPIVTVDGTVVTVVLNTNYPGTERTRSGSNFTFQVHFNKNGRSTRQSSTQAVPFTPLGLNTTINMTHDFSLSAGTYTVSVSAVNEHGSSEISSPSKQFVIEESTAPPPTSNELPVIIGAVVGGAVFVLLILIVIFICIICYMKFWRTRGHYKTESGKPVPLTNNGANGDNKEDLEMMENQTALYDEVDRAGTAATKKKEAEAMGVVNQYDDPDVQQQPEMYAEVDHSAKTSNKKKKKKEEKQQETAPQPEVYAEVDKSAKTTKKGAEAQDDEPKPPPHTEGLVYAQIDFANKSSTYKKPEPKNDDVVIYSEVTVQHQPRKQDDDKEQDGNNDRDDRGGSPNAII